MKLGFVFRSIGLNQLTYQFYKEANKYLSEHPGVHDIIAFYEEQQPIFIKPRFSAFHITDAYGYDGRIICTDVGTALKGLSFFGTIDRWFYVYDLDWIVQNHRYGFHQFKEVYSSGYYKLIARSKHHKKVIEDMWETPVYKIVPDVRISEFLKE